VLLTANAWPVRSARYPPRPRKLCPVSWSKCSLDRHRLTLRCQPQAGTSLKNGSTAWRGNSASPNLQRANRNRVTIFDLVLFYRRGWSSAFSALRNESLNQSPLSPREGAQDDSPRRSRGNREARPISAREACPPQGMACPLWRAGVSPPRSKDHFTQKLRSVGWCRLAQTALKPRHFDSRKRV
jgi:hypothetical protein